MVHGLPHVEVLSEVCEGFLECKQSRSPFNKHVPTKANDKLEVVYSDVCGEIQYESLGGNKYFFFFIDELTRKIWIYLIKRKIDVTKVFKKFQCLVGKQNGKQIKILRTNGGVEYVCDDQQSLCEEEGIIHEITPPYTPQHNGTAEKKKQDYHEYVKVHA